MEASITSSLVNNGLNIQLVSDDIKRVVMVWECLSHPYNKQYSVKDIYSICTNRIKGLSLGLSITEPEIEKILEIAFYCSNVTRTINPDNPTYQLFVTGGDNNLKKVRIYGTPIH